MNKILYLISSCAWVALVLCSSCGDTNTIVTPANPLSAIPCDSMPTGTPNTFLRIVAIQPDPTGIDDFRESIVLMNFHKSMRINISNFYIKNLLGERFELTSGFTNSCEMKTQIISSLAFLKNSGDSLYLCYGSNEVHQRIGYSNATEGAYIIVH